MYNIVTTEINNLLNFKNIFTISDYFEQVSNSCVWVLCRSRQKGGIVSREPVTRRLATSYPQGSWHTHGPLNLLLFWTEFCNQKHRIK